MSYIDGIREQLMAAVRAGRATWRPDIRRETSARFACGCLVVVTHEDGVATGIRLCDRHVGLWGPGQNEMPALIEIQREFALIELHEGPVRHLRFG